MNPETESVVLYVSKTTSTLLQELAGEFGCTVDELVEEVVEAYVEGYFTLCGENMEKV